MKSNLEWLKYDYLVYCLNNKGYKQGKELAKELNRTFNQGNDKECDIRHIDRLIDTYRDRGIFDIINVKGDNKGYIFIKTANEEQLKEINTKLEQLRASACRNFWRAKQYKETIRNLNIKELV